MALGGNGNSRPDGNGNAGGNGDSQSTSNGNAGANGNGTNGGGKAFGHDGADDETEGDTGTPSSPATTIIQEDQNTALDAVRSGAALPLSEILPQVRQRWGGRVIDTSLLRLQGALVYRFTLLSDQGVSRRVYYAARSGKPVEVR